MINFLEETVSFLALHNRDPESVMWVGVEGDFFMSWGEFAHKANVKYDNGFGANQVPLNLVVVGDNWWIERHEYDGSEWWEYKSMPMLPGDHRFEDVVGSDAVDRIELRFGR